MVEVAILVAGVDAQQVMRVGNFVHKQVVNEGAALGHQPGILRLPDDEFGSIVASHPLHQFERASARGPRFRPCGSRRTTPPGVRTASCSERMPEYSTGMSHPPKLTILAPRPR